MATAKYIGRDCELSTTGVDYRGNAILPFDVTREILAHIDAGFAPQGLATWTRGSGGASVGQGFHSSAASSDCLRHWGPNGQSYYSDMSHLEVCTAATLFPRRYAAQSMSTVLVAEAARREAEEAAEGAASYSLSTANVDMVDAAISWGTHVNVAISTCLWEDLFTDHRHPAILGFVASAMAAAIPFFGGGYLLPLKDRTIYSLSARAHHLSRIETSTTTEAFRRGLLNSRREAHGQGHERLHLIGFDFTLASAALKSCFLQCCLAAAEEGFCGMNLYDPVRALRSWSWNLDLKTGKLPATAPLAGGRLMTLPVYVRELTSRLLEMCEAGLITGAVAPETGDLLPRVIELTHYAEEGVVTKCAAHLDWAAKLLSLLDLSSSENVKLGDAATRLADHDFASTDPGKGRFWQLWEAGLVDPLIDLSDAEACLADGPPEARGWGRGRLIQRFFTAIADIDWSRVELRRSQGLWSRRLKIDMPRLDSLSRDAFEGILEEAGDLDRLEELLGRLDTAGAEDADPVIDICSELALAPVEETLEKRHSGPESGDA